MKHSITKTEEIITTEEEKIKLLLDHVADSIHDEGCGSDEYRLYQVKAVGNPKRRKYNDWMPMNPNSGSLPKLCPDRESWLSAATFCIRRKRKGYVSSINCNFVILKWRKSELDYFPTAEQGKELVLSLCRKNGLPDPTITYTADGLEVKWYWQDKMRKIFYYDDPYCNKFNDNWERMQKELYEIFRPLGVDFRKGITAMFSIPGSMRTIKRLRTKDRFIRDIHGGKMMSSYKEMQRILGLEETNYDSSEWGWERLKASNPELARQWLADVLRIHPSGRHWVCVGMLKDGWKNRWVQAHSLPDYLAHFMKSPDFEERDVYVSQGEFLTRCSRKASNLAEIHTAFVDLDYKLMTQYHSGLTEIPAWHEWKDIVREHCAKYQIPLPNDFVFTGGGVHLKWIFDEAVSRSEIEDWHYAQKLLLSQFKTLGADSASADEARVLRLPGTKNHKDSPVIKNRNVFVIDAEYFSSAKITLNELINGLEASLPGNAGEFAAVISERQKFLEDLAKFETAIKSSANDTEDFRTADSEYWTQSTLHHHRPRGTWLKAEILGVKKSIETLQLHETLKKVYGTPDFMLSMSELSGKDCREHADYIAYIPCNYVVLSCCPGETLEEQKANIFRLCNDYRESGIPLPNQIIQTGSVLLAEWTYSSPLPGCALSKWQAVQEHLRGLFKEWGAMDDPEYQKATALLPVPGFSYEDGKTARLVYSELENRYTFNRLADAVLNWSCEECRKYKQDKEKRMTAKKTAVTDSDCIEQLKKAAASEGGKGGFAAIARMRFVDILRLLEIQRDSGGEVPQKVRELSVFWALVSAKQGGMIKTYEEFCDIAGKLINFCGNNFATECTIETVKSAYKKTYRVKTSTLIQKLGISPESQQEMKVLRADIQPSKKKQQPRAEWLAEHSQTRNKVWLLYGLSERTYYRRKKAGTLPELLVQDSVCA